jgi:hypothetical protein
VSTPTFVPEDLNPVGVYLVCGRHGLRVGTVRVPPAGSAYLVSHYRPRGWRKDISRVPTAIPINAPRSLDDPSFTKALAPCPRTSHVLELPPVDDLKQAVAGFRAKGAPETIVL